MLWIVNLHTQREIRVPVKWAAAGLESLDWRRISWVFASRRTGRRRTVHPRLVRLLAQLQARFDDRRIELVSGYRVPEEPDGFESFHHVARAADLRIAGVSNRALFEACRSLARVGCGYYPAGGHVHVDVRGRSAVWVDLSPPGAPARYVSDAVEWLRSNP
jgi:uncharacterized protein YcbK (DUF882 family)